MEAAGLAVTLSVIAYRVARRIIAFRSRMTHHSNLLDSLLTYCRTVHQDACLIEERVRREDANGQGGAWNLIAIRLETMRELLANFDTELGELTPNGATSMLGRALVQMRTDDFLPRIRDIQAQISMSYQSLFLCIPFALDRTSTSPPSPAISGMSSPTLAPIYPISTLPSRSSSEASLPHESLTLEIYTATRNLDVDKVSQLLKEDERGELVQTVDAAGRTLVDIAIGDGRRTSTSQVHLVEMLLRRGVKFTLVKNKRYSQTYTEVIHTINHLNQRRKSSASARSASS